MKKINILNPEVSNKIAAGEVVERPASVVKELVENSIDAGAKNITVEIKKGGISYIRVSDDGRGIEPEDAVVAFERHATSKVQKADDLNGICTLGFRGEALASISAVAHVELITKTKTNDEGTHVVIQGGKLAKKESVGCPEGTTIIVRNLFYNVPARMKFLKKDSTEAGYISDLMNRIILGHPEISFRYINNGKELVFTSGDNKLINCIYSLYGRDYAKAVIPVEYKEDGIEIRGLIGQPELSRANRNFQSFFINGRYIKSKIITFSLEEAYKNMLMVNRFPFAVLHLYINPLLIDVNVHPTKMEVKFTNENQVSQAIYWAVKNALYAKKNIPQMQVPKKNIFEYSIKDYNTNDKKEKFIQQELKLGKKENLYDNFTVVSSSFHNNQNTKSVVSEVYSREEVENDKNTDMDESLIVGNKVEKGDHIEHKEPILDDFKIIGQLFNTYIIVQKGEEMLLIDQHAAHERLKYEDLIQRRKKDNIISQMLLVPVVIQLSATEADYVLNNINFFKNIGFEIEDFGNNSIVIRQTPIPLQEQELRDLFLQILEITQNFRNETITEIELRALYSIACKSAIKANQNIHKAEIEKLIKDLLKLENINTCPHGRPIVISMSKYYIEKQFKRIQ